MSTSSDRGLFVWHEVGTTDLRAGEDFYAKVAGWKAESWSQNPSYKLFVARREAKAGLYLITETVNAVPTPPSWLSYIGTPDVDATVRQTVELGGKVIVSVYNVPSVGRMAHLQDPQGAAFAVSSQEQRSRYKDPQFGDFSWHEFLTSNGLTAFDFYSKPVRPGQDGSPDGHGSAGDVPDFGYWRPSTRRYVQSGRIAAGRPSGFRTSWSPTRVEAESAKENGATVAHGPSEVPGGDWVFTGIDPQGAMFAAHSKKRVAAPVTTKKEAARKATTKTKDAKPAAKKAAGAKKKPARSARLQASPQKNRSQTEVGMKRLSIIALALFALSAQTSTGWVTLFNGKDLNNFNQVGTADWKIVDGVVQATTGAGHLVSKETYTDFEIKVEFYAGPKSNSGVYVRLPDGSKITDKTCYEANVFDNRPDQSGRTGGIPNYAPPIAIVNAEGKWNT